MIAKGKTKLQKSGGFALVFAIFMTMGIEMMIAGNMLNTMRQSREVQRLAAEARLQTISDSVIDRGLMLFRDYVQSKDKFPDIDGSSRVLGNDYVGTDNQTFNVFLSRWFSGDFSSRFSSDSYTRLSGHSVSPDDITIIETERGSGDQYRKYSIAVTVHSEFANTQKKLTQNITMTRGQLFNFSVYSNESLEFTAGPSWRLQGPIFSNQDIFLMNDQNSTLKLVRAKKFASVDNPEPYVMQSAETISFFFKRVFAKNYALGFSNYKDRVSSDYGDAPQGMEIDRRLSLATAKNRRPEKPFPPIGYFFTNGLTLGAKGKNAITIENSAGGLIPFVQDIARYLKSNWLYPEDYKKSGPMSYSAIIDDKKYPQLAAGWTPNNPKTTSPTANENWITPLVDTVKDSLHGVTSRDIAIGDPDNPSGPHLLIEPSTDIFPPGTTGTRSTILDNDDVKEQKLQYLADLNLYSKPPTFDAKKRTVVPGMVSDDLKDLIAKGVVQGSVISGGTRLSGFPFLRDYRELKNVYVIKMDIAKLLQQYPELLERSEGTVVYIHVYPLSNEGQAGGVQLVNAEALPKTGFTIASNGRVYVTGNYNTFSYDLPDCDIAKIGSASCDCSSAANVGKWDNEDCKTPSAGIFSDSLVYLSRDWVNPYGRAGLVSAVPSTAANISSKLSVSGDHMYNVAIATGFKLGRLTPTYPSPTKSTFAGDSPETRFLWSCPDKSYKDGKEKVKKTCEYYVNEKGLYFVNRKSDAYGVALTRGLVDPADPEFEIPIFVDGLSATKYIASRMNYEVLIPTAAMPGNFYNAFYAPYFLGKGAAGYWLPDPGQAAGCDPDTKHYRCESIRVVPCLGVPGNQCIGRTCNPADGEKPTSCSGTCAEAEVNWKTTPGACRVFRAPGTNPPTWVPGAVSNPKLDWPTYTALYNGAYGSGGLQNLINLQESWVGYKMRASGTFSAPWTSRELANDFMNGSTVYYSAPERLYDYNEDFLENSPPGTPGTLSIKRNGTE